MKLLLVEIAAVEVLNKENSPSAIKPDAAVKERSGKERIDMISQMTRTLEKLIDLKRVEAAENATRDGDPAETERLSKELVKRLQVLDRKRRGVENGASDQDASPADGAAGAVGGRAAINAVEVK